MIQSHLAEPEVFQEVLLVQRSASASRNTFNMVGGAGALAAFLLTVPSGGGWLQQTIPTSFSFWNHHAASPQPLGQGSVHTTRFKNNLKLDPNKQRLVLLGSAVL